MQRSYSRPQTIGGLKEFAGKARETGECPTCARNFASGRWAAYHGSGDYDDCPTCGETIRIMY